jgi:hypothetical protein
MRITKGSITHTKRTSKPFRWRYKGTDRYFSTNKEALKAQKAFLETRSVVGSSVSDTFKGSLERDAVEAYSILKEAGLTDTKFLIEAARIRAARGTSALSLSVAIDKIQRSPAFRSLSKGQADKYLQRWNRFLDDVGDLDLVVIDQHQIREHLEKRAEVSDTEANKTYTALAVFFRRYLVGIGVELPNPLAFILKPKQGEVESKPPYTLKELEALEMVMHETAPENEQAIYYIQKFAGYRGDEVNKLKLQDLGLGRIPLNPREELTIHFTAGTTKERKQRTRAACRKLHLTLLLNDWLTSHYTRKGDELILKPEHAKKPFYTLEPSTFTKHLHKWVNEAGVTWRKNSLRATYVSAAIKGRFSGDIEQTKDSIGHAMKSEVIRNNYLGYYSQKDSDAYFACELLQDIYLDKFNLVGERTEAEEGEETEREH